MLRDLEGGISAPTQSVINFHIRETMKRNEWEASQRGGRGRLALKPPPGLPAEWEPSRGAGGSRADAPGEIQMARRASRSRC